MISSFFYFFYQKIKEKIKGEKDKEKERNAWSQVEREKKNKASCWRINKVMWPIGLKKKEKNLFIYILLFYGGDNWKGWRQSQVNSRFLKYVF